MRKKNKATLLSNDIWVSKDGRETNIKDMGDKHLINCIKLLERKACHLNETSFKPNLGIKYKISDIFPIYDNLVAEKTKRENNITNNKMSFSNEEIYIGGRKTKQTKQGKSNVIRK